MRQLRGRSWATSACGRARPLACSSRFPLWWGLTGEAAESRKWGKEQARRTLGGLWLGSGPVGLYVQAQAWRHAALFIIT